MVKRFVFVFKDREHITDLNRCLQAELNIVPEYECVANGPDHIPWDTIVLCSDAFRFFQRQWNGTEDAFS